MAEPCRPRERPTVLLLTAETGYGHRRVARVLAEELAVLSSGEVQPVVVNAFGLAGQRTYLEGLARGGYGAMAVHAPVLWGALYHATNHRWTPELARRLAPSAVTAMVELLERLRPAIVVATHPLALWMAAAAQRDRTWHGIAPTPLWAVVTDLVSVHCMWAQPGVDRWFVGCPAGAVALARWEIETDRVCIAGLPVDHAFRVMGHRTNQLDGAAPRVRAVLVMGGGDGAGGLVAVTRAILKARLGLQVIAVCGRNQAAFGALSATATSHAGLTVHGVVDGVAPLMTRADVVVTKAGSVTIAEAAAAGRPLILSAALPGQEAGNPALVASYGAGVIAVGPARVVAALRLLQADPDLQARLVAGCRRLARPSAGDEVAGAVLARLRAGVPPFSSAPSLPGVGSRL